jgi:hypothetical protein
VTPSPAASLPAFDVSMLALNQTSTGSAGAVQLKRAERAPHSSIQNMLRSPGKLQASRAGSMSRQQPGSAPSRHRSAAGKPSWAHFSASVHCAYGTSEALPAVKPPSSVSSTMSATCGTASGDGAAAGHWNASG